MLETLDQKTPFPAAPGSRLVGSDAKQVIQREHDSDDADENADRILAYMSNGSAPYRSAISAPGSKS